MKTGAGRDRNFLPYNMKNFIIDEKFLTQETVHNEWSMYAGRTDLTEDETIKVLKGEGRMTSTSSIDNPVFTELRNQLEVDGYIKTERNWWNGDMVTKPFSLNDYKFKKGARFPCAGALKITIEVDRKYRKKNKKI